MPTFDESGLPGFEAVLHYGFAGAGRHAERRLSTGSAKSCARLSISPRCKTQIHNEGGDPLTSTPAEYAADIDKEEKKWGGLVRKLGLKVE